MILSIKVTTRAKKTEMIGCMSDGTLKIRLRAIPEDGAANAELVRFLSEHYQISRDRIKIVSGQSSQRKRILIMEEES